MLDRRDFIKGSATIGRSLLLAGPRQASLARPPASTAIGCGPLARMRDNTHGSALPAGFEYWSFGEVGSLMADGRLTPPAHDGMACFKDGRKWRLVRNHEVRNPGPAFGPLDLAYDELAPGGNTIVVFDPRDPAD